MTIDQLVAMAASIGAGMSALAAFLTIRQVSKQREASYHPELVISRIEFECTSNPLSNKNIPDIWIKKDTNNKNPDLLKSFTIPIRNVGLGTAKEVSVEWSFSIQELVNNVNKLTQKSLTPAYFEYKDEILSLISDNSGSSISMWKNQQKSTIDYILPISMDKIPVDLIVPHAFIQLISAFIHFSAKTEDFNFIKEISILTVELNYLDIGAKKHKVKFDITTNIMMIMNNGEAFQGQLESIKSV